MLSKTQLDHFTLFTIENGRFRLDGGAMFGVVPKTLWSAKIPSDDLNRIDMAMRSLLIVSENSGRVYLIDTGAGHKFDEKMSNIYGLDYNHSDMDASLASHGFKKEDITDIIFTHLHFDHCGGISRLNEQGEPELEFPDTDIWVTARQWETANNPNAREKASFFRENLDPIQKSGRLHLIDEGHEFEPGLGHLIVNGHTLGQQLPLLNTGTTKLLFAADLLPTFAHIPTPWVMGYDMYPVDTLKEKEVILGRCYESGIHLYMQHDANHEIITLKKKGAYFAMNESCSLENI
ncbi:MAG: MBL fold metallo-hydrolase [Balneolales bacterium]